MSSELGFLLAVAWVSAVLRLCTWVLQLLCFVLPTPRRRSHREARRVRRSQRLLWELCRAAAVLARQPEETLIRQVWERCRKTARQMRSGQSKRGDAEDVKVNEVCEELSKVISEGLCFESLAWRLATALAFFKESEALKFLNAAILDLGSTGMTTRDESQSEEVFFGLCRGETLTAALGILLENDLIDDAPAIDFDPWFQIKRYGYAFACFRRPISASDAWDASAPGPLEHPLRAVAAADAAFRASAGAEDASLEAAVKAALRCFARCPALAPLVPRVVQGMAEELREGEASPLGHGHGPVQQAMEALKCCGVISGAVETNDAAEEGHDGEKGPVRSFNGFLGCAVWG